jgi:hypothetical protein
MAGSQIVLELLVGNLLRFGHRYGSICVRIGTSVAGGVRFVSPDVAAISETALGFSRAVMVRDPDGHAIRLVQR